MLLNTNTINTYSTDYEMTSSYIRIFNQNSMDDRIGNTKMNIEFGFYMNKDKWASDCIYNSFYIKKPNGDRLKSNITLYYNMTSSPYGTNIIEHLYSGVKDYLLENFPTWDPEKIILIG
jgi:hypothetical protein